MGKPTKEYVNAHMRRKRRENDKPRDPVREVPQHRTFQRWTLPTGVQTHSNALYYGPLFRTRKEAIKQIPKAVRSFVRPVLTTIKHPL